MKEFADGISKCNGIEKYSSDRAENLVGNGEIAPYEQFFLLPQCFLKSSATKWSNVVIVCERVKGKAMFSSEGY